MEYKFRILKKKDDNEYRLQRRRAWSPFWRDCYLDGALLRSLHSKDVGIYGYSGAIICDRIVCSSRDKAESMKRAAECRHNPKPKEEWHPL